MNTPDESLSALSSREYSYRQIPDLATSASSFGSSQLLVAKLSESLVHKVSLLFPFLSDVKKIVTTLKLEIVVSGLSVKVINPLFPAIKAGGIVSRIKKEALVAPIVEFPT